MMLFISFLYLYKQHLEFRLPSGPKAGSGPVPVLGRPVPIRFRYGKKIPVRFRYSGYRVPWSTTNSDSSGFYTFKNGSFSTSVKWLLGSFIHLRENFYLEYFRITLLKVYVGDDRHCNSDYCRLWFLHFWLWHFQKCCVDRLRQTK